MPVIRAALQASALPTLGSLSGIERRPSHRRSGMSNGGRTAPWRDARADGERHGGRSTIEGPHSRRGLCPRILMLAKKRSDDQVLPERERDPGTQPPAWE